MQRSPALPSLRLAVLGLLCVLPLAAPAQDAAAKQQAYSHDVQVLASDKMEGRGAGTRGLERASQYIEKQFKAAGLKPAGERSYFQPFTVTTGARLSGGNHFIIGGNGAKKSLALNKDYLPLGFSSTGTISGPLVFAGYGATADEFHYDDYENLNVKGKIVVVLRYEPGAFQEKSGDKGNTPHAAIFAKAINARNHGATAMILVNGSPAGHEKEEDVLLKFGHLSGPEDVGLPVVQVSNSIAGEWFKPASKSLAQLQQSIDHDLKPQSFALPETLQAEIAVNIEKTKATVNNVLGYLPGKSDEFIIIGAHYDHLGRGDSNSLAPSQIGQIHHGADDNASGTAGMLELARTFSGRRDQLDRGILFMAFAGEELGLLGSAHWVSHPTLPVGKAVAMINLDMIGRMKDSKLYIGGIGTGSTFKALLENAASKYHFDIAYSADAYAASDHTSFVAKKIPVLFFFSGLHADYHKPSDTSDKINSASATQIVDLVADVASTLDTAQAPPQFAAVAPSNAHGEGMGGGGGYGPAFGSVPDFTETEDGVRFSDVRPGSPAAKAGLKPGDVLVEFGGKTIRNLYDFTDALRRSKVGDVVEVKVLRDGKPVQANVTLEQRK